MGHRLSSVQSGVCRRRTLGEKERCRDVGGHVCPAFAMASRRTIDFRAEVRSIRASALRIARQRKQPGRTRPPCALPSNLGFEPFHDSGLHNQSSLHEGRTKIWEGQDRYRRPAPADAFPLLSITRSWLVIGRTPRHQRLLFEPFNAHLPRSNLFPPLSEHSNRASRTGKETRVNSA